MDDQLDELDMTLLGELRAIHDVLDPPADDLTDRIKIAMTVAALHADLAEIISTPLVASRDDVASRTQSITFASGDVSLMITLSEETPSTVTVDGWVTSGGARVEVHTSGGIVTATADMHGRFALREVARGRTWFVVWADPGSEDAAPVVTPTVDL